MQRFLFVLAIVLALCLAAGTAAADALPETALELTREMGLGTNLGNTLEACDNGRGRFSEDPADYETLWGQPVTTAEMMRGLKAAGFDTLRIPVAWMTNATHLSEGDAAIDGKYMARVEQVVEDALDAGLYVILNDHWDGGWWGMFGSDSEDTRQLAMESYISMWRQIAERFRETDRRLIFESANEELGTRFDEDSPLYCDESLTHLLSDDERYRLTNEVNQAFVDTIRAAGGENEGRFLLIAGYGTNIDRTCDARFQMPRDTIADRLLISVHYYDPWSYCGASDAASATRWGTRNDLETMRKTLQKMTRFTDQGIGVVIGEYGALPGADGVQKTNAPTYHRYFLDLCELYNYCGCLWDTSGFYLRRELHFAEEDMAAVYQDREKGHAAEDIEAILAEAPETFLEEAITVTDDTCVAWIMWNSGDWAQSYSVGDTYLPDSITPGMKVTDAVIDGPGTYIVALDFTGTEKGYSNSTAFCALGIMNGEILHPGWAVHFNSLLINGEPVRLTMRPYTTSDDGHCTRANIYNEWVSVIPEDARVLYGPTIGISAVVIDRGEERMSHIETVELTFTYGPRD